MKEIFYCIQKFAYERFFLKSLITEKEISQDFFKGLKVPHNFDGFGLLVVINHAGPTGISKSYDFLYKPIQEFLAALYLTRLEPIKLVEVLSETFGNKDYEMVWVYYAGITNLKQVPLGDILAKCKLVLPQQLSIILPAKSIKDTIIAWKQCHSYYTDMINDKFNLEFLLSLILCCYEAQNSEACRDIANHLYTDKVCRLEIPPNHATPYLLLAMSYFIACSGKMWSLRCNTDIHSSIQLLAKHINDPDNHHQCYTDATNCLWVFCCVLAASDIDAYCDIIKSQSSLQWIHMLPGSYLGDSGTAKLCECLYGDSNVMKVEIDDCNIGGEGLRCIGHLLIANKKILYVDLRNNKFTFNDVMEFLQQLKNQLHLQILLFDKNYCENVEVCGLLEDINLLRAKHNAIPLRIVNQGTAVLR